MMLIIVYVLFKIYQANGCDFYDPVKFDECYSFIEQLYTDLNMAEMDIFYNIPHSKSLKMEESLRTLLTRFSQLSFSVKMVNLKGLSAIPHAEKEGNLRILFSETLDMEKIIKGNGNTLAATSKWVIIGSGNWSWTKNLSVDYNSQVLLASFNEDSTVELSEIYTLSGRLYMKAVAAWEPNNEKPFPKRVSDSRLYRSMEGEQLSLIVREDPPFIIYNDQSNETDYLSGFLIDLWRILEQDCNFTSQIYISNKTLEGSYNESSITQFKWTGVIGESQENNVDVVLMVKHISTKLSVIYDSTLPVVSFTLAIYQQIERPNPWRIVINIASKWISLLSILFGVICGCILYYKGLPAPEAFIVLLAIFLRQDCCLPAEILSRAHSPTPFTTTSRIAIISTIILIFYIMLVSLCDITSHVISKPKPKPLILYDLLDPAIKIAIVKNSATHNIIKEDKNGILHQIFHKIQKSNGFVKNITAGLEMVSHKGIIFLEMKERASVYMKKYECCVQQSLTSYSTLAGILVKKDLQFIEKINFQLIKLSENGLYSHLREKWWPEKKSNKNKKFQQISLGDIWQIFANFLFGVFIACVLLVVEKYYTKSRN